MSNSTQSEQKETTGFSPGKILIFQTAFLGDVILTLPLVDAIHTLWPDTEIHFVTNPSATGVLENHPFIQKVIPYDKRGNDKGLSGLFKFAQRLKEEKYHIVFSPHRSFRSALTLFLSGIQTRIGFSKTPGAFLYTHQYQRQILQYEGARNLELLQLFEEPSTFSSTPVLPLHSAISNSVTEFLPGDEKVIIALAPGSVWATKRWPEGHWKELAATFAAEGKNVVLIGGPEDKELCERIADGNETIYLAAGKTSILESIEIIRKCSLLVTNDTAPLHMGVGAGTPVLAIFGPTIPEYGFAPPGEKDRVIGLDLECRPCAIHGGPKCPLGHFDCMKKLLPEAVIKVANEMI